MCVISQTPEKTGGIPHQLPPTHTGHKVPHLEIRSRARIDPLETILSQRQLRWLGHTIRMPADRLPRKLLYSELTDGTWRTGATLPKWFKDHIKTMLKKCNIIPSSVEDPVSSRQGWRDACRTEAKQLNDEINTTAERRRLRHHEQPNADGNFPCNVCDRICKSSIGLMSHHRVHK